MIVENFTKQCENIATMDDPVTTAYLMRQLMLRSLFIFQDVPLFCLGQRALWTGHNDDQEIIARPDFGAHACAGMGNPTTWMRFVAYVVVGIHATQLPDLLRVGDLPNVPGTPRADQFPEAEDEYLRPWGASTCIRRTAIWRSS
jgi:hypothetical protein